MIPIDSSLTSILHQSIQTVCSTGFSRLDTIPPKGGTTNITFNLMQNPITLGLPLMRFGPVFGLLHRTDQKIPSSTSQIKENTLT